MVPRYYTRKRIRKKEGKVDKPKEVKFLAVHEPNTILPDESAWLDLSVLTIYDP